MRVLVTGAGGFLGSYICRHFGSAHHAIAALGRVAVEDAIAPRYPGLELLAGMTLPDPAFVRALASFRPDVVVHAASTARVAESVTAPYADFQASVDVCAFVLDALRQHAPRATFVLLSSAAVYGDPESQPIAENAACRPLSPYGYHKWLTELVVEEYRRLFGLRTRTLRIFSAYGEGLRRQVLFDLCARLSESGDELSLFGTADESRDFVHASDVALAVERALLADDDESVFNVASGVETRIAELVELLARGLGREKHVSFAGQRLPGYPARWRADIRSLGHHGFTPAVALADGVARYCRWYREHG